jgi:small ligand-binding sensory domain FIST
VSRVAAGLSVTTDAAEAGREAATAARAELEAAEVDLAFCFLSADHADHVEEVGRSVSEQLQPRVLLGCVAQGIVGRERELEDGPAVAVWAASLPGSAIEAFHLTGEIGDDDATIEGLPDLDAAELVVLLVDPFTFPADVLLHRAAEDHPGLPFVGGIAVAGSGPGTQTLIRDAEIFRDGAVGAALRGVPVTAVVSQGCAPLGRDAVITRAEGNVVLELAGKPALEHLRATIASLSPREQALATRGLLAGLVIDENKPEYGRGDFLVRSIIGADEASGAIAVGERVRTGQTLRFHARDAESADEDLALALGEALGGSAGRRAGALLFTCNGRGAAMFGSPDHDAGAVARALGQPAVAGFFCGGEIGPVGGRSFLHGFTATMVVFGDPRPAEAP